MQPQRNFFSLLFDMSFEQFVTPRIVRAIYGVIIVVAAVAALGLTGIALDAGPGAILSLLLAVLIFFFYVITARVALEAILAVFRIAENTSAMARNSRSDGPPPPDQPLP